jgi:uncharacterized protein
MVADWFGAAESGNTGDLLALLATGAQIDAQDEKGRTALMRAVEARRTEVIEALLREGANAEIEDNLGWTAMTRAVIQAADWLVHRVHRSDRTPDGGPMDALAAAGVRFRLREAVALGDVDLARRICERDPAVDISGDAGFFTHETFLMLAARSGSAQMVNLLLDLGADVDCMDDIGYTPLMAAAQDGHSAIAALLIDRGADVNNGWPWITALSLAESAGRQEAVSLLLSRGARRRLVDAIELGDASLAATLLRDGADANSYYLYCERVEDGSQAPEYRLARVAMRAAERGNAELVSLLLDHGASHYVTPPDEHSLLAEAARAGHLLVVRLLIARGAGLNTVGSDGLTALAWALRSGHLAIVAELRRAGAAE